MQVYKPKCSEWVAGDEVGVGADGGRERRKK